MRIYVSSAAYAALLALSAWPQTAAATVIPSHTPARDLKLKNNKGPPKPPEKPGKDTGTPATEAEGSCGGDQVASVLFASDLVEAQGCTSTSSLGNAVDGTTEEYQCIRDSSAKTDAIVVSNVGRSSIVDGLRVYANKNCEACDPVKYKVEGRGGPNCYRINVPGIASGEEEEEPVAAGVEAFKLISKGELPWIDNALGATPRNNQPNQAISSSYTDGDTSLSFTEVGWTNNGSDGPSECRDYRISFGMARDDESKVIVAGEVELFGAVTSPCTGPTTASPTRTPTPLPTNAPSPSTATGSPTCGQPFETNLLFPGDDVETFGCDSAITPEKAFDGIISSYICPLDADNTTKDELIVSNRRRQSVAEVLRVYANDDCYDCDPVDFKVEGRGGDNCYRINSAAAAEEEGAVIAGTEPFKLLRKGALPWAASTTAEVPRNTLGAPVTNSGLTFTEIDLLNDGEFGPAECRDYRVTFGEPRAGTLLKVGEVQLEGRITNACDAFAPTQSPVGCSGLSRRICRRTQGCDYAKRTCSPDF